MLKFILLFGLLTSLSAFAQEKKIIDHTVYNDWKSLKNAKVSNDGKFITYEVNPHRGDGFLFIYNTDTKKLDSIPRGTMASFSGNSSFLAFKIRPGYDTLRTLELKKVKKVKWPKDSLGILILDSDSLIKFPKLKTFQITDESDWMAVQFDHNKVKEPKKKKKWCKKKRDPEYKSNGKVLWVLNPITNDKFEYKDVSKFALSDKGEHVAFSVHKKIKIDSLQLNIFDTKNKTLWSDAKQYTDIQKLTFDDHEKYLAGLWSSDTSKIKNYSLGAVSLSNNSFRILADTTQNFILDGDAVSIHYQPRFDDRSKVLYFGVAEQPKEEPKDTLLASEKVKLDIWHHKDKRLQPQQLKELKRDEKRSDLYVYHLANGNVAKLTNDTLRGYANTKIRGNFILVENTNPYEHTYNWEVPRPVDYYRIHIETGKPELLIKGNRFDVGLSPSGRYYTYYGDDKQYYVVRVESGQEQCMTCGTENVIWTGDINGMPMDAYPHGIEGWSKDEYKVYIQSRYDVWAYDLKTRSIECITQRMGQSDKIRMRPKWWSHDSVYFDYENVYIEGFDETTKGMHFYNLVEHKDHSDLVDFGYFDASVRNLVRSKNKERFIVRKMTFEQYPDLFTYTTDMWKMEQVSHCNPQQKNYNWGTVELVKWKSYEGLELEGLLYKPENFDPNKEYPLMVYFYELYTDRLHQHYIPKPTASIIYATEYASAGYVVFMPDIRYTPGHPAKSAYDCIMSGTDHVLSLLPNVDSTRMALQGQSWGGYQTAQLVTMTKRYAAAMAGAPVSNMFSAYGGIRWGSGYNRQFQYERTQSRIGATIWEKPELYVENSPLFHVPNVTTPLLIMHNDNDGAVPWYQGIELFTGMKRLGKEVWLLNYNDDGHNLMRNANRMDLSIRMRQFFDHYLMDKPSPQWLLEGLPAMKKGKELRYE